MKRSWYIFIIALFLLSGCQRQPEPTEVPTEPSRQLSTEIPSEALTEVTTEPTTEPATEPTEVPPTQASPVLITDIMNEAGFQQLRNYYIYTGTDGEITVPYWNLHLSVPEDWLDQVYILVEHFGNRSIEEIVFVNRKLDAACCSTVDSSIQALLDGTSGRNSSANMDWAVRMFNISRRNAQEYRESISNAGTSMCKDCLFGYVVAERDDMVYVAHRRGYCESCGKYSGATAQAINKIGESAFSEANGYWVPDADEIKEMVSFVEAAP